jgi:hypothetical protein
MAVVLLSVLLTPSVTKANIVGCSGNIAGAYVDITGNLWVLPTGGDWGIPLAGGWLDLCNINTGTGQATPATCKEWHAILMLAYATGNQSIRQFSSSGTLPSCGQLTNSVIPVPSYIANN